MADVTLDREDPQYDVLRQQLLDDFEAWLAKQGTTDDGEIAFHAQLFVDWCAGYSTGELSRIGVGDMQEFLLEWCPRKVSAPPSFAGPLCTSLQSFVAFLAATGRLRGGLRMSDLLTGYLRKNVGRVKAAMGDTSKFGMAKSLFAGPDPDEFFSAQSPEELQALVEQRMAAHNALPIEERRAATDQFFDPDSYEPEPYELPFSYLPPADDDVVSSANAAPLLVTFDQLRDYLGENGRLLTSNGNVKLGDARELVDLLQTGDVMDAQIGDRTYKTQSSRDLRQLSRIVDWATEAGAVRLERNRLKPVKRWASYSPVDRVKRCWEFLLKAGPLFDLRADMGRLSDITNLTQTSAFHWLIRILPAGDSADVDEIVESTQEIVDEESADWEEFWLTSAEHFIVRDVAESLQTFEFAGMLTWESWEHVTDEYGDRTRQGGLITLTPIGRLLVAERAADFGYRLDTVPDLRTMTAPELIKVLRNTPATPPEIIERWHPDTPADRRAAMLTTAITDDSIASDRLAAISLLYELPAAAVEPSIRSWLNGPAAGYAAAFLIERGMATTDDFDSSVGIGPFVDAMSLASDDPEQQLEQWQQLVGDGIDADQLLDDMWRHEVPETEAVLESLGKVIPDQRVAKLARKALFKHRGRMSNRRTGAPRGEH